MQKNTLFLRRPSTEKYEKESLQWSQGAYLATAYFQPYVPELYVSFPSRILFGWVTPLVLRGFRKPLTEQDCWELAHSERTVTVVEQVQHTMESRMNKSRDQKILVNHPNYCDTDDSKPEQHTLLEFTHVVGTITCAHYLCCNPEHVSSHPWMYKVHHPNDRKPFSSGELCFVRIVGDLSLVDSSNSAMTLHSSPVPWFWSRHFIDPR